MVTVSWRRFRCQADLHQGLDDAILSMYCNQKSLLIYAHLYCDCDGYINARPIVVAHHSLKDLNTLHNIHCNGSPGMYIVL